jgi:hypothetical protein
MLDNCLSSRRTPLTKNTLIALNLVWFQKDEIRNQITSVKKDIVRYQLNKIIICVYP